MGERFYWQAISDCAAVAWSEETREAGPAVTGPVGLVMWGTVNWTGLQGVQLSRLISSRPGYPEWDQKEPPSLEEIRKRWNAAARTRERHAVLSASASGGSRRKSKGTASARIIFGPRSDNESVDAFYRRVADFYTRAVNESGKPTQALAESADVPRSTAARWVSQARQRGFLAPTSKGRSRA
jgi:hypothetical protein